jgi:hypothetical protein
MENKWYLVVETPTTPCDAFFFPDQISVNAVEDRNSPTWYRAKGVIVESCDF